MNTQDDAVDAAFEPGEGIFAESAGEPLGAASLLVTTGRDSQETGASDVILTDATELGT